MGARDRAQRASPPPEDSPEPGDRPAVSDRLGAHAARLIEALLEDAARRGEALVSWVRLAVCGAVLARLLYFSGRALLAGDARDVLDTAALVVAVSASIALLSYLRRAAGPELPPRASLAPVRPRARPRLDLITGGSVLLDAGLIFELMLSSIVWHGSGYQGLLPDVRFAGLLLAVFSLSLRLSVRSIGLGVAAHGASLAVLLVVDHASAAPLGYGAAAIVLAWILFAGAAAMAMLLARRSRQLVLSSAGALLQAEHVRQRLGAYVSEEVAEQSLQRGALALGGVRRDIAVLFTDLRGFTAWAEKLSPEALVAELNAYFEAMMRAIRAHGGVVDKYIGDSIMVVFGVPRASPDDAARAVRAAAAMQSALAAHNEERAARGLPELRQGVGLHYGPAIAGHIGTADRLQYTVVGDTVNMASRLEAATKDHGTSVLISAAAVDAARASAGPEGLPPLEPLGVVSLRGRESPVEVFTLAGSTVSLAEPDVRAAG